MPINKFNYIDYRLNKSKFKSKETCRINVPFEGKDKKDFYLKGVVPGQIIKSDHINWILSELGVKFNEHIKKYYSLITGLNTKIDNLVDSLNILVENSNKMENDYNNVIKSKIDALESKLLDKIKTEKNDLIDRISLARNENVMIKNSLSSLYKNYDNLTTRVDKHEACTDALMSDVRYIHPYITTTSTDKDNEAISTEFDYLEVIKLSQTSSVKEFLKYLFSESEYTPSPYENENIFYGKLYKEVFAGVIFRNGSFLLLKNKEYIFIDEEFIERSREEPYDYYFPNNSEAFLYYTIGSYKESNCVVCLNKSVVEKFGKVKQVFFFRPTIKGITTTGTDSLKKIIEEWKKSH